MLFFWKYATPYPVSCTHKRKMYKTDGVVVMFLHIHKLMCMMIFISHMLCLPPKTRHNSLPMKTRFVPCVIYALNVEERLSLHGNWLHSLLKSSQGNPARAQRSSWGKYWITIGTYWTELSLAALQTLWLDWVYFLWTVMSSKNKTVVMTQTVINRRTAQSGASAGGAATGPPGSEEADGTKGEEYRWWRDIRWNLQMHQQYHSCCRPSCPRSNVSWKIWPENVFTDKSMKHLCMLYSSHAPTLYLNPMFVSVCC